MSTSSVSGLVRDAVQAVPGAFDQLVVRFQDMAVGTAYGWLKDLSQAEDAAQEAFVEVHRNLDRIEDPAAFPGFLRRVVLKHCDRRTRGVRRELTVGDPGAGEAAGGLIADASLSVAEDRARVRAAVEELPAPERLAVALHYLAGLTQNEVADWLELPLSTVKKRLHTARGRLRDAMESSMDETFEAMRPSRNSLFSDTIRLFLGIREGDVAGVRLLLDQSPDLVEVEERWDDDLTRAHALPIPNGGTPLVRAAQRNQVEMIDLLLDRGAEIDRRCSCAGAESALWAAVASGQLEATRRLLERGANPDQASFADHTPLHVAALRGLAEIVELLCRHGADGTRRDNRGRTPADWASTKGHDAIAARLVDRFGASGAGRARSQRPAADVPPFETGIKALDLFAPLFPGSLGYTRFDSGLGTVIFLAELSARWNHRMDAPGPSVIWVGWERQSVDLSEMEHAFAELGLSGRAQLVWSPASDDEDERRRTMDRAVDLARSMQARGVAHPLIIAFAHRGRRSEIEAALPGLRDSHDARITTLVAERDGDPASESRPIASPFDFRLAFDPALAALGHFPALHPLRSESAALTEERVGEEHFRLAAAARDLFARQREIVPDLADGDPTTQTPEEQQIVRRARRLQAYLTQPFEVAETFTGEPARELTIASTLADVRRILAGELDDLDPGRLVYKGALSDVLSPEPRSA